MNKRRQIYYHAVFGAIGGLLAWLIVGSLNISDWNVWLYNPFVGAGVGLFIGAMAAAPEGAIIKQSVSRTLEGLWKGATIGFVGGLLGLFIGGAFFILLGGGFFGRLLGWLILGLFLGIGQGIVERSQKRLTYGAIGGAVAGAVGGLIYEVVTRTFIQDSGQAQLYVSALGLILIGACLGGIIPFVVTVLAEGKLHVLNGRKMGLIVDIIDAVTLGSYDGCHLYLPGDPGIDKKHARVYRDTEAFFVQDLGSALGTTLDNVHVEARSSLPMQKGSKIQLGSTLVELV